MGWLRHIWCWFLGHARIQGICVRCYRGANGARLRPISGGQDEWFPSDPGGLTDFASSLPSDMNFFPGGGSTPDFTMPTFPDTPAPSGLSKFASNLGAGLSKEVTDSPLKALSAALGIGATGFGIANQANVAGQVGQQTKILQGAQKSAQAAAAPAVAFGTTTLNAAAGGNLTPALQAQIDEWTNRAKADARARMASMGLGNSTQINQLEALIDEQAMAMKGQMLQQQEETGLAGLQTGVSAGSAVMGSSQNQQAMLAQLIGQANQALGSLSGRTG